MGKKVNNNLPAKGDQNDQYDIVQRSPEEIREILAEIGSLSVGDLDRARMPTGSSTKWSIESLNGDQEIDSIIGIILFWKDGRVFWNSSDPVPGTPPNCISEDCIHGSGYRDDTDEDSQDLHHECEGCRYNEFGTRKRGKACKQRRIVFLLQRDCLVPIYFQLPITSIPGSKKYHRRLVERPPHRRIFEVETSWTLKTAQNADGIKYPVAVPVFVRDLSEEEKAKISELVNQYIPVFKKIRIDTEE